MAQILVRNLDDELKERLRRAAAEHGHSMEEEARVILHRALQSVDSPQPEQSHIGLSSRIQALLVGVEFPQEFFDSLEEIRHGSDMINVEPRAAHFDE